MPLPAFRGFRPLLGRLGEGRAAAVEDVQAAEELVEAARPRADAEERARDAEENRQEDVGELGLAPQPREEELLVRVTAARVPAAALAGSPHRPLLLLRPLPHACRPLRLSPPPPSTPPQRPHPPPRA